MASPDSAQRPLKAAASAQLLPAVWICAVLAAATAAAFWPVLSSGFIDFDDGDYIIGNAPVRSGLSWRGVVWALTTGHASNWHPLTWLSHMLDVQLFGLSAGGHHAVNLLFHVVNVILLFLLLKQMTGALWRSGIVAGFFALHPMHVESVAWVSERKDVLSAFFFLLTLLAYAKYAARKENRGLRTADAPSSILHPPSSTTPRPALWYALSLLLFALGLMSKPMLVTLPFVLLLLDYWPLRRFDLSTLHSPLSTLRPLLLEKLPFFALSLVSSVVTFLVQRTAGAMAPLNAMPLPDRLENALVAYVRYLGKLLWPNELAIFYPRVAGLHMVYLVGAGLLLAALTAATLLLARRWRFLATGWFWFAGMLIPVIGLVQVGNQSMADRYSYLPYIGLFVVIVWGAGAFAARYPLTARPLAALSGVLLALCALATGVQAGFWHDSETLFGHALAVTRENATAHFSMANALIERGQIPEGVEHLQEALRIEPNFANAYGRLAYLRAGQGNFEEATTGYRKALQIKPDLTEALNNLAWLLATCPDPKFRNGVEAVRLAERACQLTHFQRTMAMGTLAAAYASAGRFPEAVAMAERARDNALLWGETDLAQRNRQLLELYQAGKPFYEGR
jgi:protein O-mannosyl-transferase